MVSNGFLFSFLCLDEDGKWGRKFKEKIYSNKRKLKYQKFERNKITFLSIFSNEEYKYKGKTNKFNK